MFCPGCGSEQSADLRFCKLCGANLHAVRQAMTMREADEKFDWSKTWVAEMFLSEGERKRRAEDLERQRGITPDVKRHQEIKAGVITSSIGVGLSIFLYVLMQGIILSGNVAPGVDQILSRIWVAGVIPLFVGIALIINGAVVSKKLAEVRKDSGSEANAFDIHNGPQGLRHGDTTEFPPSVTEGTTKHLGQSEKSF